MRIGIDVLAVQSPWSRTRGIGRLGHHLVCALLDYDRDNEYILYGFDGLPTDRIPSSGRALIKLLKQEPERGDVTFHNVIDRLVRTNPDGLDVFFTLSPMEFHFGYGPPLKPLNGLAVAAVVHDVIPFLYQEQYLTDQVLAGALYRHLERLRHYDVLLSNSNATRADFLRLLGLRESQVVTISCATEAGHFAPDRSEPMPAESAAVLKRFGVKRPFVFNLGGMDENNDRKNLFGLVDAFRFLPEAIRQTHQLVLSCYMSDPFMARLRTFAAERGVEQQLVLTNEVDDQTLRVFYQRCALFVFPSLYEGFGLPLLEAMQCGAPIVAGNNSSQIEVVGSGGLLANVQDPADLADKMALVLKDVKLAAELSQRAVEQSNTFRWEKTAERTVNALTEAVRRNARSPVARGRSRPRKIRADRSHAPRPRIAVFSPFAPKGSGISDYAARLVHHLQPYYAIDLFHDAGYVPDLGLSSPDFGCHDYRLFDRFASVVNYRGILYQMGNSIYHRFVYETMLRHRGIVTLHDFCLSAFQYWWAHLPGNDLSAFEHELRYCYPDRAHEWIAQLPEWGKEPGGIQVACPRRGLYLNRRVFDTSHRVIVHSPWCKKQVQAQYPEHEKSAAVIPMGATPRWTTAAERAAIRQRYGLPDDALILASFGILTRGKMNDEAIEAFAPLARSNPRALFLFVGPDWENGEARRKAESLGLAHRVRFLGRLAADDFADLIAITDIGVALRRPPTDGETSASLLDLLRSGVATITTDVATFADYPDSAVRKIKWELEGIEGLRHAIEELAADPVRRTELAEAGRRYVVDNHSWPNAAARYRDLIELVHEETHPRPPCQNESASGPHRTAMRESAASHSNR